SAGTRRRGGGRLPRRRCQAGPRPDDSTSCETLLRETQPRAGDSRTAGREPPGAETGGSGDLVDEAEPERLLRRQPQLPAGEQLPDLLRPDRAAGLRGAASVDTGHVLSQRVVLRHVVLELLSLPPGDRRRRMQMQVGVLADHPPVAGLDQQPSHGAGHTRHYRCDRRPVIVIRLPRGYRVGDAANLVEQVQARVHVAAGRVELYPDRLPGPKHREPTKLHPGTLRAPSGHRAEEPDNAVVEVVERLLVSVVRALGAAEVAVVLCSVLLVTKLDPLQLQVQLRRGRLGLGLAGGGILVGHTGSLLPSWAQVALLVKEIGRSGCELLKYAGQERRLSQRSPGGLPFGGPDKEWLRELPARSPVAVGAGWDEVLRVVGPAGGARDDVVDVLKRPMAVDA